MSLPLIALVLSNLVPLAGVSFFGWSLFSVMFLYWLENVFVGIWNLVKMITAKGAKDELAGMIFACVFFTFHYGLFCVAHGVFVFVLFGGLIDEFPFNNAGVQKATFSWPIAFAALGLFISHGVSYFVDYIGKGGRARTNAHELLDKPYGRMMLLHVAIVLGGGVCMTLGQPIVVLIILVILKIVFDIRAHRKSLETKTPKNEIVKQDSAAQ